VIIGATSEGEKELVGLIDGVRESAQSWKELLLDLKCRGLTIGPELAVAIGINTSRLFDRRAISQPSATCTSGSTASTCRPGSRTPPKNRGQRCWVHKTANVLNKLPKASNRKPSAHCRSSDRKLKQLPPEPFRHQDSAIARGQFPSTPTRKSTPGFASPPPVAGRSRLDVRCKGPPAGPGLIFCGEGRKHAVDYFLDLPDRNGELTGQSRRAAPLFPAPKNGLFHILIINRDQLDAVRHGALYDAKGAL